MAAIRNSRMFKTCHNFPADGYQANKTLIKLNSGRSFNIIGRFVNKLVLYINFALQVIVLIQLIVSSIKQENANKTIFLEPT